MVAIEIAEIADAADAAAAVAAGAAAVVDLNYISQHAGSFRAPVDHRMSWQCAAGDCRRALWPVTAMIAHNSGWAFVLDSYCPPNPSRPSHFH